MYHLRCLRVPPGVRVLQVEYHCSMQSVTMWNVTEVETLSVQTSCNPPILSSFKWFPCVHVCLLSCSDLSWLLRLDYCVFCRIPYIVLLISEVVKLSALKTAFKLTETQLFGVNMNWFWYFPRTNQELRGVLNDILSDTSVLTVSNKSVISYSTSCQLPLNDRIVTFTFSFRFLCLMLQIFVPYTACTPFFRFWLSRA
jgi:hypothetical protein